MCGIIGYTGYRNAKEILLKGLQTLEYRGYDSAGIVLINQDEKISITKCAGKVERLVDMCAREADSTAVCGIGHTRWATHGGVTNENAHPHRHGRVTLIHNGIIENYQELITKYNLAQRLSSQTDSEVAAALLDLYYQENPKAAIRQVVSELKGTFALAVLFEGVSDKIYAIRNVSPIIAAVGREGKEAFIASDVTALSEYVEKYFVVPEYALAVIEAGRITLLNEEDEEIEPEYLTADWKMGSTGKNGYAYYMEKEIMEQPEVIRDTIMTRYQEGLPDFSVDKIPDDIFTGYSKITIIGCGTAMHAGLVAKSLLQSMLGIQVTVEIASEFIYNNPVVDKDTLVIAISQSGETIDTLEALRYARKRNAGNLSIVNVKGSTIARESEYVLYTNAGPEIAVASTKAYTTQLTALYLITCKMAYLRGIYSAEQARAFMDELIRVPQVMQLVLAEREAIHAMSAKISAARDVFMIGRGLDYTALLEGSLKLKEISYIHSEAYAAGELKHGTIALVTQETPVIALVTQTAVASKELSNAIEVRARGARVIVLTTKSIRLENIDAWEEVYYLPDIQEGFMVFPAVAVLQLMAFYVSRDKGLDVDKPRNLAKVVTVE